MKFQPVPLGDKLKLLKLVRRKFKGVVIKDEVLPGVEFISFSGIRNVDDLYRSVEIAVRLLLGRSARTFDVGRIRDWDGRPTGVLATIQFVITDPTVSEANSWPGATGSTKPRKPKGTVKEFV